MRQEIELKCECCGKIFKRKLSEHNRNINRGRRIFCSLTCSGSTFNQHLKPYHGKNLDKLRSNNKLDSYSSFRYYLRKAKDRKKGNTDLTLEYLKELWEKQNGKCSYSNINMNLYDYKGNKMPNTASLDRIDSNLGYIKGNVQFICYSLNTAKNDFSDKVFRDFLQQIKNS